MPVVRLSENSLLRLILPVPESAVPTVHIGQQVEVRVATLNRSFPGKVARFVDKLSLATRTMDTEVDVPNPSLVLIPGMFAEVDLTLERHPSVVSIPVMAVDRDAGDGFGETAAGRVMVVTPSHRVESRQVSLRRRHGRSERAIQPSAGRGSPAQAYRAGRRVGVSIPCLDLRSAIRISLS
jgi:multidrug efflux pump subunit AcrA (membrane-fusion protein)